jgi:hypothetical protein
MSFKFLVGLSFSHEASTTKDLTKAWGIGLSDDFGPPGCTDQTAAAEYSFRIYFLPVPPADPKGLAPNYWVQELKNYAKEAQLDPDAIDGNACAWKIVYVVDHYVLNNGTKYDYPGAERHPSTR